MNTNRPLYPALQDLDLAGVDPRFGASVAMSQTGWLITDRFVTLRIVDLGVDGWEVVLHGSFRDHPREIPFPVKGFIHKVMVRNPFSDSTLCSTYQRTERDSDPSAVVALSRLLDRIPAVQPDYPVLARIATQIATLADRGGPVTPVEVQLPEPGETVYLRDLTRFPEMHLHAHNFRDEVLIPTLVRQFNTGKVVAVDLSTDICGIGTIFLREVFQEIPYLLGVTKEDLLDNRIRIVGARASTLAEEIRDYVMNYNP